MAWVAGCGAAGTSHAAAVDASGEARMTGDWDDLDVSIEVATEAVECTVVRSATIEDGSRRFELVSIRDEPGELTVWREGEVIAARARIGRFGDVEREGHLLAALAKRLKQLHGVDVAPR